MMTILLGILKITGIVILSLLAFLLVCLLILLFCPICYSLQGNYIDSKPYVAGRVSFLGLLFRFDFRYNNEDLWYQAKILFFTLFSSEPKKIKKRKTKTKIKKQSTKKKNEEKNDNKVKVDKTHYPQETKDTNSIKQEEKPRNSESITDTSSDSDDLKESNSVPKQKNKKQRRKERPKEKKASFFTKIKSAIQHLKNNLKKSWKRFCSVKKKAQLLVKLKNAETTKMAYKAIKQYIKTIFRHIRPRTMKGHLAFGFEDPAHTGELLGVLSLLYPVYKNQIRIIPYFDRPFLEADLMLKGHVQIIVFTITAIKLYTNKYIKKTIERWNRIKGGK